MSTIPDMCWQHDSAKDFHQLASRPRITLSPYNFGVVTAASLPLHELPANHAVVTVRVWGGGKCASPEPSEPTLTVHRSCDRSIADALAWGVMGTRTAGDSSGQP
jgi:hypothetical protein